MREETFDLGKLWIILFISGLAIGIMILGWVYILGPLFNQVDNTNFQTSPEHVQAVAGRLTDDCVQIAQTTDKTAIKAIEGDIVYQSHQAPMNLVQQNLSTQTLTCVNQAIHDQEGK